MLQHLKVNNLAIVEEATITFGPGLNIITGETGAGKSVLMGALSLVLGERADKSIIRAGAEEGRVEACFTLPECSPINALLIAREAPPCEEGVLLIKRTLCVRGAGRTLVNDAPVTVQTLREIAPLLVDIHGPYDQQSLLLPEFQRSLLDAYGRCGRALGDYQETWDAVRDRHAALTALTSDTADAAAEIDLLKHAIGEIKAAALSEADEESLVEEHSQAANAVEILALGAEITDALSEADISAYSRLLDARIKAGELARVLPDAAEWLSEIQNSVLQVQELCGTINGCLSRIDSDPDRLQHLEERMALVQRLKRKYGGSVAAIARTLEKQETRLDDLENRAEKIEKLTLQINALNTVLLEKAALLTQTRRKACGTLAKAITAVLKDLGFANAAFGVRLQPGPPAKHGADEIVFEFAPNPGEPPRPLKSIASSGEIARVMLAVKAVLAAQDSIPILVFDEIDANIGGETGRAVGQKLKQVAASHQVIAITHLPQSAVYGEQHVKIFKEVHDNRTRMKARILEPEERVDEIARMLGGKGLTSVIENHAREMLEAAAALAG